MHWKRGEDLGAFEKGSWVESCLGRRRLTFACSRRPCDVCARDGWRADGKARIERMCISPYVEEPLNSKVIKTFVPEVVSVFRVSRFLCSMYIWVINSICTFYIFMYGICYTTSPEESKHWIQSSCIPVKNRPCVTS